MIVSKCSSELVKSEAKNYCLEKDNTVKQKKKGIKWKQNN